MVAERSITPTPRQDPADSVLFSGRTLLIALLLSIPCVLLTMLLLGSGLDNGKAGAAALVSILVFAVLGEWIRQRFRFSMRSLLLIMTAFAVVMALFAQQVIRARRDRVAALLIQRVGGSVTYDFQNDSGDWFVTQSGILLPNWLRQFAGDEMFGQVVAVNFWGSHCQDEDLAVVCRQLDDIKSIRVARSRITAEGIEHLRHLKSLETLEVESVQLSAKGVRHLAELPQLREMRLVGTGPSREALAELPKLRALRSLFAPTDLSDADLEAMSGMERLDELILRGSLLTDAAIPHIGNWAEHLQTLVLIQTQLTDAGVRELVEVCAPHGKLEHLGLHGAPITDEAIDDLARLSSLKYLYLGNTLISEAGKDELQERLPRCHITR